MEMAYYSGSKEKDAFRRCIDILIRTETMIRRYDKFKPLVLAFLNQYLAW